MSKGFWIGLSLINLAVVALFGLLMRSKFVFSIPFLDYRNLLSAHSQFAFAGWAGLALTTLLIFDVLPGGLAGKKIYRRTLWGLQIGAAGMGLSFFLFGHHPVSVFFSSLYIVASYVFGVAYFKDARRPGLAPEVMWLALGAVVSLLLSVIGPLPLWFIQAGGAGNSLLHRDAVYSFMHLQYNGFFTLSVFAVLFSHWRKKEGTLPKAARRFSLALLISVIPSIFTALLWHNLVLFYVLAAVGCLFLLLSASYFFVLLQQSLRQALFKQPLARLLWLASGISFFLKMVLTTGTLYPPLGNAVYGARPVIIGFLHLAFLGFISFFLLAMFIEAGFFIRRKKTMAFPFLLFGSGIVANEFFLLLQGLSVLFYTNSPVFYWLLWGASIFMFTGALLLAIRFYHIQHSHKKTAANAAVFSASK